MSFAFHGRQFLWNKTIIHMLSKAIIFLKKYMFLKTEHADSFAHWSIGEVLTAQKCNSFWDARGESFQLILC